MESQAFLGGAIGAAYIMLAPFGMFFIFNSIKRHLPRNVFEAALTFIGWLPIILFYVVKSFLTYSPEGGIT